MVGALVLTCVLLGACSGEPILPDPPTEPLLLVAKVNVQLGDTPVGSQPFYIVTGYAEAEEAGQARDARIDSVVVEYALNTGAWTRARRTSQLPFSDALPFTVSTGDVYRLVARLHASAVDDGSVRHTLMAEWSASGAARAP